jgi:hypothetical protein
MKCQKCKKGKLFSVPPLEGEKESSSEACDNPDCDFQRVFGTDLSPEEFASIRQNEF